MAAIFKNKRILRANLGIKRQKAFLHLPMVIAGVVLPHFRIHGKSEVTCVVLAVATPAMIYVCRQWHQNPDPGKSSEQLCHTSIKVRNSKLGFTTTIYSSNNNNNHTFFSKFWHNSRVYRVQQIPARGSFLGSSKCWPDIKSGSLATWSSDLQASVFASRGCGGFWLHIDLLSII